jgi:hypothetical protein
MSSIGPLPSQPRGTIEPRRGDLLHAVEHCEAAWHRNLRPPRSIGTARQTPFSPSQVKRTPGAYGRKCAGAERPAGAAGATFGVLILSLWHHRPGPVSSPSPVALICAAAVCHQCPPVHRRRSRRRFPAADGWRPDQVVIVRRPCVMRASKPAAAIMPASSTSRGHRRFEGCGRVFPIFVEPQGVEVPHA